MYGRHPKCREIGTGIRGCIKIRRELWLRELPRREVWFGRLGLGDAEALAHFLVEKTFAGRVWLDPFAINYELRNRAFARVFDDFVNRTGRAFDVNFFEGNIVLGQKAFGDTAVGAPKCGVNDQVGHRLFIGRLIRFVQLAGNQLRCLAQPRLSLYQLHVLKSRQSALVHDVAGV